jgi:hypothetical protein
MIENNILIWRESNNHHEYRFASHAMTTAAMNWLAPGVDAAPARLNRVWQGWAAEDGLATRRQLLLLAEDYQALSPSPVQLILLLNSTVARELSPYPWLEMLKQARNADLIRSLETPDDHLLEHHSDREDQEDAKSLLGVSTKNDTHNALPTADRFGSVAHAAATHPDPVKRQTSALALMAAYPQAALTRLESALTDAAQGRARRAEVRGVLANADSDIDQQNAGINPLDRFFIWWWRIRRRLVHDRNRLLGYSLGSAVGAGLGLGLWRGITSGMAGYSIGIHFAVNAFTGAILGGLLSLGMTLADSLQLKSTQRANNGDYEQSLPSSPAVTICLGSILFGFAHVLVTTFTGLPITAYTTIILGLTAGAGLSTALYAPPWVTWRIGSKWATFRLGAVMILFGFIQWLAGKLQTTGLTFVWPQATFCSNAEAIFGSSCDSMSKLLPEWQNLASAVDAGITALVLSIGIALGLLMAASILEKWNSLIPQDED